MISNEKTTAILDALWYCNKYLVGIEKEYINHFYKIKHAILAHIYRKPNSISGYVANLNCIELQDCGDHTAELLSVSVSNDTKTYNFHVPLNNKNKRKFDPDYFYRWNEISVLDELSRQEYQCDPKESGDQTQWMEQYNVLKEIAYCWGILNRHEEVMKLATKHPEQWKQYWSMFVVAFNKRFKKQYIIRESETDKRKCEIVRYHDDRVMYDIFKFKMMKGQAYINYMSRINRNIEWH